MAVVQIHPIKITGRWKSGISLDLHTTSSTPIGYNEFGHMQFDTVRPEIAELLYRLKNRADRAAAEPIIETVAGFLAEHREKFNIIIPVPPSTQRAVQPVIILAEGIGKALNVPVVSCISTTRPTSQLKNITDPKERKKQIEGLYAVDCGQTRDQNILLFDDLFRSGTTMNAIADLLLTDGKASSVRALTITKTRSNQ
jgi:predicted amidophosphoribosyltransferase